MERRLVSELNGIGKIFRGDSLLMEAPYSIRIYQEFLSGIPGLMQVIGSITADSLRIMPLIGEELTIELDNGSTMGFFFSDSNGRIANTTGILTPREVESA